MALLPTTTVEAKNAHGWVRVHVADEDNDRIAKLDAEVGGTKLSESRSVKSRLSIVEMGKVLPLLQKGLQLFREAGPSDQTITLVLRGEKNGHVYMSPPFDLSVNATAKALLTTFRQRLDQLVAQTK